MLLLKPRGRLRRVTLSSQQIINALTESRIDHYTLELVPRNCLQDNPRILREFPQYGIKSAPHFVRRMVPRPAHVQRKLCQGIEPLDFRGKEAVDRVADASLSAHGFWQSPSGGKRETRSSSAIPPLVRVPGPAASDHIATDAIQPDGLSAERHASGQSPGKQPCPYNSQQS